MRAGGQPTFTLREINTLVLVDAYREVEHRAPSLAEIAKALGLKRKLQARRIVTSLERRGAIVRSGRRLPHARAPSLQIVGAP